MAGKELHDILGVIHQRKSVRHFSMSPVETEKIETILKAAMAAPSARNIQPWLFYVINRRQTLDQLAEQLPFAKMLSTSPLAIVIAGDTQKGNPGEEQRLNWAFDCAAATQNLLLAAEAIGLGTVWTGVFPYQKRVEAVSTALSFPAHIVPFNIIPVGYPAHEEQPKVKWDPEKVHWVK